MTQHLQFRLKGVLASDWHDDLMEELGQNNLASEIKLVSRNQHPKYGLSASIDPTVLAAIISGGSAIIASIIPIMVNIFRSKSSNTSSNINVNIHGTANSVTLTLPGTEVTQQSIKKIAQSIGVITEIEIDSAME